MIFILFDDPSKTVYTLLDICSISVLVSDGPFKEGKWKRGDVRARFLIWGSSFRNVTDFFSNKENAFSKFPENPQTQHLWIILLKRKDELNSSDRRGDTCVRTVPVEVPVAISVYSAASHFRIGMSRTRLSPQTILTARMRSTRNQLNTGFASLMLINISD